MKDPSAKIAQKLLDRRDYRNTLIQRRNAIDVKLAQVDAEIAQLRKKE